MNRLVTPETFNSVKEMAEVLDCSEGEVIDQAVMLFQEMQGNGVARNAPSDEARNHAISIGGGTLAGSLRDPASIPGVSRGIPEQGLLPRRPESAMERTIRERKERDDRARARSSIADDPSFVVDPEFVQD